MKIKNSATEYGLVTKAIHWITALCVIGLLALGLYMSDLPVSPDKFKLYALHKSTGITVLALTALRLLWRLTQYPDLVETLKPWEGRLARLTHFLLYAALIAMPVTGWLMSSAGGYTVSFFGLFAIPDLISPDKEIAKVFKGWHENIGTAVIVLVSLHVAAALKHHIIDKDRTLKRMLPWS